MLTTAAVLISLWPLRVLAYHLFLRARPEERPLEIELPSGASAQPVLAAVEELGIEVESLQLERSRDGLLVVLRAAFPEGARTTLARLADLEDVRAVRWSS